MATNVYNESVYRNPLNTTNRLLIRTPLARSKPTIHSLPPSHHTYGRVLAPVDINNSVSQALTWDSAKTNRRLKNKRQPSRANPSTQSDAAKYTTIHGKASLASECIGDVISNAFQRQAIIQAKQKTLTSSQLVSPRAAKQVKHTVASKAHAAAGQAMNSTMNNENAPGNATKVFKMKKFSNVEPRVQMPHIVAKQKLLAESKKLAADNANNSVATQSIEAPMESEEAAAEPVEQVAQ